MDFKGGMNLKVREKVIELLEKLDVLDFDFEKEKENVIQFVRKELKKKWDKNMKRKNKLE